MPLSRAASMAEITSSIAFLPLGAGVAPSGAVSAGASALTSLARGALPSLVSLAMECFTLSDDPGSSGEPELGRFTILIYPSAQEEKRLLGDRGHGGGQEHTDQSEGGGAEQSAEDEQEWMNPYESSQDQGCDQVAVDLLGQEREKPDRDGKGASRRRLHQRQGHRQGAPQEGTEERDDLHHQRHGRDQQGHPQAEQAQTESGDDSDEETGQELPPDVLQEHPVQPRHQPASGLLLGVGQETAKAGG